MRSAFDQSRDQRIANESAVDQALMCHALGCPNRWAVDAGSGRLCSAHAWSEPHLWPQITQAQKDAEADRARRVPGPKAEVAQWSRAQKIQALRDMRRLFVGETKHPRAWAHALRDREGKGERLSLTQREAWRAALHGHQVLDDVTHGFNVPVMAITEALRLTGDIPWPDRDVPPFEEHA